jgi:hypothetical protein
MTTTSPFLSLLKTLYPPPPLFFFSSVGLDSFSALSLIETLTSLCQRGRTIVISIHQPRSDIFSAFTHITLLTRGRLAYSGERTKVWDFFEGTCGLSVGLHTITSTSTKKSKHKLNSDDHANKEGGGDDEIQEDKKEEEDEIGINGADFLIDVTQVDDRGDDEQMALETERVDRIVALWKTESAKLLCSATTTSNLTKGDAAKDTPFNTAPETGKSLQIQTQTGASFLQQLSILTTRLLTNLKEDRLALWGSILEVLIVGTALGLVYFKMEETPAGIQGRKSLLYSVGALQNYLGLMFVIWKLSKE